jgi:sugar lactone lactonase YvrE
LIANHPFSCLVSELSIPHLSLPPSRFFKRWTQNAITIAGGRQLGSEVSQLRYPVSVRIDDNAQSLFIADHWNNRIATWKKDATCGQIFIDESVAIAGTSQLNCPGDIIIDEINDSLIICDTGNRQIVQRPRHDGVQGKIIIPNVECWGLAMDDSGNLYVSDYKRHEVRRWRIGETQGTVVAGGNKRGSRLDQLDSPTNIFVDHEQSVYVSDHFNHRVVMWREGAKEGVVVAGSRTEGDSMAQLSGPRGILVDQFGTVLVADSNNHRIMRWLQGATKGSIAVGGNGHGDRSDQLFYPRGLCTDRQGNLYVADSDNHRIQKFNLESS